MADFDPSVILQRINILTNFMNSVVTLSKKIFELPEATAGPKLVAAWNTTSEQTEKFDLSAALAGVYALTNGIIQLGTVPIPRVDDTFTFDVGYIWRLSGIVYQNPDIIERTIDAAGTGNHRIDIAVMDENNDIYIIQGFEVPLADTVVQPATPPDTIFLCSFSIEEDTIGGAVLTPVLFLQKVRIRKGFGNFDTSIDEVGDIFQFGFVRVEDGVKCFADFAVYTGGGIDDNSNYTDMTVKEIS